MVNLVALKAAEAQRFARMKVTPMRVRELDSIARAIFADRDRYLRVERGLQAVKLFVPWWFVAIVHDRESGRRFDCQLGQGDPLSHVSTHVPVGRGPFIDHPGQEYTAWERSCFDALVDCAPHSAKNTDWSIGSVLVAFEEYNGMGYAALGHVSPYVWSFTDQYVRGKFIKDGVYNASAVDEQAGCAAILSRLMAIDSTIKFANPQPRDVGAFGSIAASNGPAGN